MDDISRSHLASAESFLKRYENARVVIALTDQNACEMITERILAASIGSLLT